MLLDDELGVYINIAPFATLPTPFDGASVDGVDIRLIR